MSFQTMNLIVKVILVIAVGFVGLVVLSFPVLVAIAIRQVIDRRKRNWRDRWARQRVLQQAVAGIAASNHAVTALSVEAYPAPAEMGMDGPPDPNDMD